MQGAGLLVLSALVALYGGYAAGLAWKENEGGAPAEWVLGVGAVAVTGILLAAFFGGALWLWVSYRAWHFCPTAIGLLIAISLLLACLTGPFGGAVALVTIAGSVQVLGRQREQARV